MHRRRRELWILIALTALLAAPLRGAADEAGERAGWSAWRQQLGIRAVPFASGAAQADVRQLPVVGGRAVADAWSGVRLWARGAGYAVGRRSAGYGLQGGAAWRLGDGVDLTAGYRLTGWSLGDRLDPEIADVADRDGAPFVGVDIEF